MLLVGLGDSHKMSVSLISLRATMSRFQVSSVSHMDKDAPLCRGSIATVKEAGVLFGIFLLSPHNKNDSLKDTNGE